MNRLQEKYYKKIIPAFQKEFNLKNPLAVPRLLKVVVNIGIGKLESDKEGFKNANEVLTILTGQKPLGTRARVAIADFKIIKGDIVGLKVTLRHKKMFQFIDKLFTIALPRVRDFTGLKDTSFDKAGNYTLGLREQIIFPEIDYDKIDKVRGLEITFVTSSKEQKKVYRILEMLGMPFVKKEPK